MHYFTSDLHLGHENAIHFDNRPFSSVADMDNQIIENFRRRLKPEDDLWIVGDFVHGANVALAERFFSEVQGRKHLVVGNHDRNVAVSPHR